MNADISELKPDPNDLVVIPLGMSIPDDVPFLVHRIKFLNKPSIIKSGYSTMNMLETYTPAVLRKWFGFLGETLSESMNDKVQLAKAEMIKDEPYLPKFYRYSRLLAPIKQSAGESWALSAKGGLTLFVELNPRENAFAFSYALCNTEDNFAKAKGRILAKERFDTEDWYEIDNYDPTLSVLENIKEALKKLLSPGKDSTIVSPDEGIHFSSLSEKMKVLELKQIYERI
jgi:hypothetical protein